MNGEFLQFEALFIYSTEGMIICDAEGKIVLANPRALSLFGYTQGEIIGMSVEQLVPDQYKEHHADHRKQFLKNPVSRPMGVGRELYAQRRDGTLFPVEISLSQYASDEEHFTIAFIIDITERKKVQDLIIKMNAELERKVEERTARLTEALAELEQSKEELSRALTKERELNEMKSRFVSAASHEFRTPLSTILSSVSLIGKYREGNDQEKREKHILRVKSAINDLTDILNDFLSIGKLEEGKITANLQKLSICDLAEEIIQEIRTIAKPNQSILYECDGFPLVVTDRSIVKNILYNLLSNAIKYSSDDGTVRLEIIVRDKRLILSIHDNGIGIPTEEQEHLFERFFRGRNVTNIQGTGLGLHIVGKYVELLHGTISFESTENVGSTFTVDIPLHIYVEENSAD